MRSLNLNANSCALRGGGPWIFPAKAASSTLRGRKPRTRLRTALQSGIRTVDPVFRLSPALSYWNRSRHMRLGRFDKTQRDPEHGLRANPFNMPTLADSHIGIGGFDVRCSGYDEARRVIGESLRERRKLAVFFANTHFVTRCQALMPQIRRNPAVYILNDGIGVNLAAY